MSRASTRWRSARCPGRDCLKGGCRYECAYADSHGRRPARGVAVSAVAAGVSAALPWRCRLRRIPRKGALGGRLRLSAFGVTGEPFRISTRPGVLACRNCRRQTGLTVGTVMERSHTPLSTWFWAAYLVASQTQGMSAVQFQRQLGLTRYETAFQILHKLRAGMVRPHQDRIGGRANEHVEVDETWIGGRTRGE